MQPPEHRNLQSGPKACRENSLSGKLHGLIIKLVGTEAAKKAQTAIEGWRKAEKKAAKDKEAPSSESLQQHQMLTPHFKRKTRGSLAYAAVSFSMEPIQHETTDQRQGSWGQAIHKSPMLHL